MKLIRECERYAEACEDVTSKCYMHMVAALYVTLPCKTSPNWDGMQKVLLIWRANTAYLYFGDLAAMFQSLLKVRSGDSAGFAEFAKMMLLWLPTNR